MFDFEHFRSEYRKLHLELYNFGLALDNDEKLVSYFNEAMDASRLLMGRIHLIKFHLDERSPVKENKEQNTFFKGQEGS